MRIGIDLSPAVYRRGGMGRYAQELTVALKNIAPEHTYIGFYNSYVNDATPPPPLDQLERVTVPWHNKPWRFRVLLAQYLRCSQDHLISDVDLFHGTDHLLPFLSHIATVFTVQDLTFLLTNTHTTLNTLFLKLAMPRFLAEARRVIVPSMATKQDVLQHYNVAVSKIETIPDGVNHRFFARNPDAVVHVRHKYDLPETFILTVGTIEPRKNLPRLLDAVAQLHDRGLEIPLVIAGKAGWRSETVLNRLKRLQAEHIVYRIGFVDDTDLPGLYRAATLFVYPSLYEGFGLPVLEAMASGVPVITSNTSSLPEVAGDAAVLIDPTNTDEIAAAMYRILMNEDTIAELQAQGPLHARAFS
ncbi:MAG: glycosyltransferase family 4 protein, partial [Anaerolineae bacterium]|nr:glycosyltransferase family 4 protein [Anaerolineae bacterium]